MKRSNPPLRHCGSLIGLLAFLGAALILAGTAAAADTPATDWSSAQAVAALKQSPTGITWAHISGNGTVTGVVEAWDPFGYGGGKVLSAACRGLGAPSEDRFAAFSCQIQWVPRGNINFAVSNATVWTRPWSAETSCASTRSIADCPPAPPPHPLRADPRICGSLGGTPAACLSEAATTAVLPHAQAGGPNLGCLAISAFVYHCSWGYPTLTGAATVRFIPGKTAWTTRVE
jgi:hypothetical protein